MTNWGAGNTNISGHQFPLVFPISARVFPGSPRLSITTAVGGSCFGTGMHGGLSAASLLSAHCTHPVHRATLGSLSTLLLPQLPTVQILLLLLPSPLMP